MPQNLAFQPSTSGFRFANSFPNVPLLTFHIPLIGRDITIGQASNGLCGGMVFTALDYFEAGLTPPRDASPPSEGALFDFLVQRLIDSWDYRNLGLGGVDRYVELMSLPDTSPVVAGVEIPKSSRSSTMIAEWQSIKQDLDNGHPSPLGLVKVDSADKVDQIGLNHQVVAYGYEEVGSRVTLSIYDPNFPGDNTIRLTADLRNPSQSCNVSCTTVSPGSDWLQQCCRRRSMNSCQDHI
jgi:hypothetical protein